MGECVSPKFFMMNKLHGIDATNLSIKGRVPGRFLIHYVPLW